MKKVVLFYLFGCASILAFAAFPIEAQVLIIEDDPERFKLDILGFLLGIFTIWLMPYSLALLLVKKKNFRKSLAFGWLAGLVLVIIIVILVFLGPEQLLLY